MVSKEKIEVVPGSGNVFLDVGFPNPVVENAKAILSAQIIKSLDSQGLSLRKAQTLTKVQAGDFCLIRNANLKHFTIDRLIKILKKLDPKIEIGLKFTGGLKNSQNQKAQAN